MTAVARLRGHRGRVRCVAFAERLDERLLYSDSVTTTTTTVKQGALHAISGSSDCDAIVWRLRSPLNRNAEWSVAVRVPHDQPLARVALFEWVLDAENGQLGLLAITSSSSSGGGDDDCKSEINLTRMITTLSDSPSPNLKVASRVIVDRPERLREELEKVLPSRAFAEVVELRWNRCRQTDCTERTKNAPRIEYEPDSEEVVVTLATQHRPQVVRILTGQMRLTCVGFLAKKMMLYTADVDGTLKLFDVDVAVDDRNEYIWLPAHVFDSHSGCINDVAIDPLKGSVALTASDDSTCFLIDLYATERGALLAMASSTHSRLGSSCSPGLRSIFCTDNRRVPLTIRAMLIP